MAKALQSFEDISDKATVAPNLAALRAEMKARGLTGFIVPRADEHQGEYVPESAQRLAWLTSFTGSAGMAVVLTDKAAAFVDGRYTLQLKAQTDTRLFETQDLIPEGPENWLRKQKTLRGGQVGYDPWLHTLNAAERLQKAVTAAGGELVPCATNPLDAAWADRPAPPSAPAIVQPFALAGEESEAKRARIAQDMKEQGIDTAVLTLPDSICWLFNIRGNDVPYTPFALSFALLHADGSADLFIDGRKTTAELIAHLGHTVRCAAPSKFLPALEALSGKTVLADPASAAAIIFHRLQETGAVIRPGADPCQLPKARKNAIELEGARKAHKRDGAAVVNFLAWLSREAPKGGVTEISAAQKLEEFRHATGVLADLSFDSISAAGAHAALPHYHVTVSTNAPLAPGNVYLIDSGGQYRDGTTDITRTVIIGTPTAEMKSCFTRVLRGHIALASARFPAGTTGPALDVLARLPLWEAGLDFDHGTGHGVGSYLSVHEGPHRIAKAGNPVALAPGMIVSDEPGYYREGAFGIRCENLIAVRKCRKFSDHDFLEFETLTLCPFDISLIDMNLFGEAERNWLNAYHARVYAELEDLVMPEAKSWLANATRAI